MSYEKQYFENGEVLTAEKLNHMEDGIAAQDMNSDKLDNIQNTLYEVSSKIDNLSNGGGGGVNTEGLWVSENGDYYPPDGTYYNHVNVNVQGGGGSTENEDKIVTGQGLYEYTNDRVYSVKSHMFYECSELQSVHMNNVSEIQLYAFKGCSCLSHVDMPNIMSLDEGAFENCSSISNFIVSNIYYIGSRAFFQCSDLNTVICTNLSSTDNGDAVKIGNRAFAYTNLTSLVLRVDTMVVLTCMPDEELMTFFETPIANGTGYIYVPRDLIDTYKANERWSAYSDQFRALEDYTYNGDIYSDLNPDLI